MTYEVAQGEAGESTLTLYGGALEFARCKKPEVVVHGPSETGKTVAALTKLHICACKYPGAALAMVRKTQKSAYASTIVTFERRILGPDKAQWPCEKYGGEKPEWYQYRNGARIWVMGMDNPDKVLSSEFDIIYVNQCEELALEEWETLTTRTTGRAGNMPYAQTIGDCNPAWPMHWIYTRDSLKVFHSKHHENPALFDPVTGAMTAQGKRTMRVLENLTGVRRTRFLEGKAARPEGMVYEAWDETTHLVYRKRVPKLRRFVAAQDWGYTNPGCLGVWGLDNDDNMYLVAQVYSVRKLNSWWKDRVVELDDEYGLEVVACDPSQPEYIRSYRDAGLNAIPAFNEVQPGIDAVADRLGDPPSLFIVHDSIRHADERLKRDKKPWRVQDEFVGYVWADRKGKEQPAKEDDHGLDMTRYAVCYVDRVGRAKPQDEAPDETPSFDAGSGYTVPGRGSLRGQL